MYSPPPPLLQRDFTTLPGRPTLSVEFESMGGTRGEGGGGAWNTLLLLMTAAAACCPPLLLLGAAAVWGALLLPGGQLMVVVTPLSPSRPPVCSEGGVCGGGVPRQL